MNIRQLTLALCGIALLHSSCNKQDQTQQPFTYTYVNNTDKPINIDIYTVREDYNNNRNVYLHGVADANGGTFAIPSSQLTSQTGYFVDWYTDDYTYTNWHNQEGFVEMFGTGFKPSRQNNTNLLQSTNDYARRVFLNGSDTQTTWNAVDGWMYGHGENGGDTTRWSNLTDNQRFRQLVFKKDFSVIYYYMGDNGQLDNLHLIFRTPPMGTTPGLTQSIVYIHSGKDHYARMGTAIYNINYSADSTGSGAAGSTLTLNLGDDGVFTMTKGVVLKHK